MIKNFLFTTFLSVNLLNINVLFKESLVENENLIYVTLRLSKYDAHILFTENLLIFCRQPFRHQEAHLFPTTFTSLEHNIHILGSQLPHPETTTVTDCRHSTV